MPIIKNPVVVMSGGEDVFAGIFDKSISGDITLPQTTTQVPRYVFQDCASITGVTIGNAVTTIQNNAFDGCTSLSRINFPASLTTIQSQAFYRVGNLGDIVIPDTVTSLGQYAFWECQTTGTITIGTGVTTLPRYVFACPKATAIYIKGTITTIDSAAFPIARTLDIYVPWSEGDVAGAPWGASNATIHYNYTGE